MRASASAGTDFGTPCAEKTTGDFAMLRRDLGEFLDEHRAQALQPLDDVAVVHDLVADIDRRAIFLQRQHDDLDGAVDAGAKAAWLAKPDRQRWLGGGLRHDSGSVDQSRNEVRTPTLSRAAAHDPENRNRFSERIMRQTKSVTASFARPTGRAAL